MKTQIFTLKTERQGYYDITRTVREAVRESGIQSGIAVVSARTRPARSRSTRTLTRT